MVLLYLSWLSYSKSEQGPIKHHHGATVDRFLSYIFFILTRNYNQIATI